MLTPGVLARREAGKTNPAKAAKCEQRLDISASAVFFEPRDRLIVDPRPCFGFRYELVDMDLFPVGKCNAHIPSWLGLHLDRLEFRFRLICAHSFTVGETGPIALGPNSPATFKLADYRAAADNRSPTGSFQVGRKKRAASSPPLTLVDCAAWAHISADRYAVTSMPAQTSVTTGAVQFIEISSSSIPGGPVSHGKRDMHRERARGHPEFQGDEGLDFDRCTHRAHRIVAMGARGAEQTPLQRRRCACRSCLRNARRWRRPRRRTVRAAPGPPPVFEDRRV